MHLSLSCAPLLERCNLQHAGICLRHIHGIVFHSLVAVDKAKPPPATRRFEQRLFIPRRAQGHSGELSHPPRSYRVAREAHRFIRHACALPLRLPFAIFRFESKTRLCMSRPAIRSYSQLPFPPSEREAQ